MAYSPSNTTTVKVIVEGWAVYFFCNTMYIEIQVTSLVMIVTQKKNCLKITKVTRSKFTVVNLNTAVVTISEAMEVD